MLRLIRPKTDLRTLITLLAVASIVITLANSLYATWRVQRDVLINNTLESNRVYATKLASTTEMFFEMAQSQLAWSAQNLGKSMDSDDVMQNEVERLRQQTNSFNSVVIADANGWVKAISPESLMLKGVHLTTSTSTQALAERKPLIGKPGISAANNLIVFISSPVWSPAGTYLGFVGGTIYLKKKSILNELLGEQFYRDGSSLFVVDKDNRVLYHQNINLVGQKIPLMIDDELKKNSRNGFLRLQGNNGEPMLAGYAVVPTSGWTIVALKPMHTTLAPLTSLLMKVLQHSIPFALLTLIIAWILARLIALPLWQLARKASQMDAQGVSKEINGIRSWYYESSQIKRAMLAGIGLLQDKIGRLKFEVQTDPLTGLLNRRGLNAVLEYFHATRQPFAVLALDIDHFKRVNDTWGHNVGDQVIQRVALQLENSSRQTDVVSRNGGEEFLMILPGAEREIAVGIAERVRLTVEQEELPAVGHISISIGVAFWSADETPMERVFKLADDALYEAKHAGRNRVITSPRCAAIMLELESR
ncbi:sensor domain-containing diguanylate cyclase [Erwinia psidii]|uniref:diguanylate cyclase n=1 Tax=Erwinia psidii TaxID=69224 RepID=A0A3N6SJE3_9GAMM|nr:sensor domain-containing diguanylate cyclase [Erwinia psidii]MCX8956746.1 GGDEF domain-containing protein [Erwinia psidii]MCX8964374.1 GGDEF domain-containing protein [Erwinia psidii]RQM40073.1 GGDEF domain-containing protein [Erwinia psidii]